MNPNPTMLFTGAVLLALTFLLERGSATGYDSTSQVVAAQSQEVDLAPLAREPGDPIVVAAVRERLGSLQGCYEHALERDPLLEGHIEVELTIGATGSVEAAKVAANALPAADLGACVVARVRDWKLPSPTGGSLTVVFPFDFTPAS